MTTQSDKVKEFAQEFLHDPVKDFRFSEILSLAEMLVVAVDALEKTRFALQCMIIKYNGKVPGLTDEQVFHGALSARDDGTETLKRLAQMAEGK